MTQPVVDILGKKLSKLEPLREKILKGHKIKKTDGGKILLNEIFARNKSCFILRNWKEVGFEFETKKHFLSPVVGKK